MVSPSAGGSFSICRQVRLQAGLLRRRNRVRRRRLLIAARQPAVTGLGPRLDEEVAPKPRLADPVGTGRETKARDLGPRESSDVAPAGTVPHSASVRVLVLGAGAIGGYFGGRMLAAGRDVTFLVRPARQLELAAIGLHIRSHKGDVELPHPPVITAAGVSGPYELILLACKGYDLEGALDAIAPAVGGHTLILPVLNGMRHVDVLAERFGREKVLGGHCILTATLDEAGRVLHLPDLGDQDLLAFGELDGGVTPRVAEVEREIAGAGFEVRANEDELQQMWEKWVGLAAGAGITCLMRGAIGDIVEAGGADLSRILLAETSAIAADSGYAPRREVVAQMETILTEPGSHFTGSIGRDLEHGKRVEAEDILGDLLRRSPDAEPRSLLRIAYVHLKTYEARRTRENAPARVGPATSTPDGVGRPDPAARRRAGAQA